MNLDEIQFVKIGDAKDINELKRIIVSLVAKLNDTKYKTEIIKLCFILDYLYCKRFGTKIGPTTVEYIKYNYGPYSESFIEAFGQLIKEGVLIEVSLPFGVGYSLSKEVEINISEKAKEILEELVKEYSKKSLKELKSFIYQTSEFKGTDFGKPIIFN